MLEGEWGQEARYVAGLSAIGLLLVAIEYIVETSLGWRYAILALTLVSGLFGAAHPRHSWVTGITLGSTPLMTTVVFGAAQSLNPGITLAGQGAGTRWLLCFLAPSLLAVNAGARGARWLARGISASMSE